MESDIRNTVQELGGATPPRSRYPLLPGVRSRIVQTSRLAQHVYESGPVDAEPLVLVHGNASSARFFEEFMATLPEYYIVAPDMRGYGASEAVPADARRGLRDYSDDLHALIEALGIGRFHLLGWSLGGNIALQYTLDHPERVAALVLQASGSPYGFGGTAGPDGHPNTPDFAGTGAGVINPLAVERFQAQDATADSPFSPRAAMRQLYVKPSFHFAPEREDILVEQMLLMVIGDQFYPGDSVPADNWPFKGPGIYGPNNGLSPKYLNQSGLPNLAVKPPILWIRGADDQIVADASMADVGQLGKMGLIPGWPGEDAFPPQPMVTQLRAVLDAYAAAGGSYREEVLADCGHSPLIEHPDQVRALLLAFLPAITAEISQPAATAPEKAVEAPAAPPHAEADPAPPATTMAAPPKRRRILDFLRRSQ